MAAEDEGSGGGGGPTKDTRYMCQLLDQVPYDGAPATILKVGDKLDVKWTLKNIGTKKWESATYGWVAYEEKVRSDVPANLLLTTNKSQHLPHIALTQRQ